MYFVAAWSSSSWKKKLSDLHLKISQNAHVLSLSLTLCQRRHHNSGVAIILKLVSWYSGGLLVVITYGAQSSVNQIIACFNNNNITGHCSNSCSLLLLLPIHSTNQTTISCRSSSGEFLKGKRSPLFLYDSLSQMLIIYGLIKPLRPPRKSAEGTSNFTFTASFLHLRK